MRSALNLPVKVSSAGEAYVVLPGEVNLGSAQDVLEALTSVLAQEKTKGICLDFLQVTSFDSAGALAISNITRQAESQGLPIAYAGMSKEVSGLLSLIPKGKPKPSLTSPKAHEGAIQKLGGATLTLFSDCTFIIGFVGDACIGLFQACIRPRKVRWADTITHVMRSGVDAVPIVLLISFLIGLIMGFQAAIQLRQFGANIFVADLVGLAQVRELGPLMTAIIVAGRSGSAYAAEIGTMKVSEEVDALSTMGLDTTRFLLVPRVLALLVALPILTLMADAIGIFGGLVVGVGALDLTVTQYINESMRVIHLFDVFSGVIKSVVFAFLVAGVGCMRGFQVKGGAEGVGMATTSSVVSGIFLVILADSVFTVLFSYF
jgi:phospholipid/cholesterol/gamma-HCH transport system permease protein